MNRDFGLLAAQIGAGPWMLANRFSALDLYAAMIISWAEDPKQLFRSHPALGGHFQRVAERPAVAPVWARNGLLVA